MNPQTGNVCPWQTASRLRLFSRPTILLPVLCLSLLTAPSARAQLAITEIMSWASTNCLGCATPAGCHPDFWELTNFGSRDVDLGGYWFADQNASFPEWAWALPDGLHIRPGESIIFVREGWPAVADAAGFRRWWGNDRLPPDLQIVFYPQRYGFDNLQDAARLWDTTSNIVDQVYFGEARRGFTFDYDLSTAEPRISAAGVCGAFLAASDCGDVGSPGTAPCGPVPITITRQPVSQAVDAGSDVAFIVDAIGVPRPLRFEWRHNGEVLPSNDSAVDQVPIVVNYAGCGVGWKNPARRQDLIIKGVRPADAGSYFVVFDNGLMRATSTAVTLTVNTNPMPPRFGCPPGDVLFPSIAGQSLTTLAVTPLQTAQFEVIPRGIPKPQVQWSWSADGVRFTELADATNQSLAVTPVIQGHAGVYRVRLQNALGTTDAFARLDVRNPPSLKITEVMADSCRIYEDWWELTNLGEAPEDLYGYRWDDQPGNIGGGSTLLESIRIQPGESIIFLEGITPEAFTAYWGADQLPAGLRFVRYVANGFDPNGDEVNLWMPTATDRTDRVDSVVFSRSPGASLWFAKDDLCSEFGVSTVAGECGAFTSTAGCDTASPGWTPSTPPQLTSVHREASGEVRLAWKAQPGSTNVLQSCRRLGAPGADGEWVDLGTFTSPRALVTAVDTSAAGAGQRFYRVRRVAPADCPCFF